MQKAAAKWLVVAGMVISLNASGWAEDLDAGKAEYLSSCATCHGSDGKGDGPRSSKLKKKPADLTAFAKKNKGVFPVSDVTEAIDGRKAIDAHGTREMPVWGCRHTPSSISPTEKSKLNRSRNRASDEPKVYRIDPYKSLDLSCDPEDIIANRIVSVVEYLRRIQEK